MLASVPDPARAFWLFVSALAGAVPAVPLVREEHLFRSFKDR